MPGSFSVSFYRKSTGLTCSLKKFLSTSFYFLRQGLTSLPRLALNFSTIVRAAGPQHQARLELLWFNMFVRRLIISSFSFLSGDGDIAHLQDCCLHISKALRLIFSTTITRCGSTLLSSYLTWVVERGRRIRGSKPFLASYILNWRLGFTT